MIYKLIGTIIMKDGGKVAIDTGGVAYEVSLSMNSYAAMPMIAENTELFTHFVMKEDGVSLYGFTTLDEKAQFLLLNTVSKIGPKLALTILSSIDAPELAAAVVGGDVVRLSSLPGIGKKTAERIIVELKDKMKSFNIAPSASSSAPKSVCEDVISALCNLGYKTVDCEKIVSLFGDEKDFNTLLRKSLARLSQV